MIARSELEMAGYEIEEEAPHIWKVARQNGEEIDWIDLEEVRFNYHYREHR